MRYPLDLRQTPYSCRGSYLAMSHLSENYQGQGFGKLAMKELIKIVTEKYKISTVYLSFVEDNKVARKLYENIGFKFTGECDPEGELIYRYDLI